MKKCARWKPVLNGNVFCSPACGGGCTLQEFQNAGRYAETLCWRIASMVGGKWKPRIWENLGWHYSATSACGRLKVHSHHYGKGQVTFTAFLGEPDVGGGRWAQSGKTPRAAVRKVIAQARADVATLGALIVDLPEIAR